MMGSRMAGLRRGVGAGVLAVGVLATGTVAAGPVSAAPAPSGPVGAVQREYVVKPPVKRAHAVKPWAKRAPVRRPHAPRPPRPGVPPRDYNFWYTGPDNYGKPFKWAAPGTNWDVDPTGPARLHYSDHYLMICWPTEKSTDGCSPGARWVPPYATYRGTHPQRGLPGDVCGVDVVCFGGPGSSSPWVPQQRIPYCKPRQNPGVVDCIPRRR